MLHPNRDEPRSKMIKYLFISDVNCQSIANFSTNFVYSLLMLLLIYASAFSTKHNPNDLQTYKNLVFTYYLLSPGLALLFYVSMYYLSHKPLRTTIVIACKEFWADLRD